MRTSLARLPIAALVAVGLVAGVELMGRATGHGSPGVARVIKAISMQDLKAKLAQPVANLDPNERNPFNLLDKAQQILPFVGFGFATTDLPDPIQRDYFGFRNHLGDGVYVHHDRPLIVMTGNSELAGLFHPKDVGLLLEEELQRRGLSFSVLNLGVGGYSLAAEISTYLQFGDRLCPSLVIAHSGKVDMDYGMVVPAKFRQLGLHYNPPMEEWAYRLTTLKAYSGPSVWRQHDPNARFEDVESNLEMLIAQYRSVVERGGHTKFLFGAQKAGAPLWIFPFMTQALQDQGYAYLKASLERLSVDYVWFSDDPKVKMADNIHTTAESAQRIAEMYADWIQAHARELRTDVGNSGRCWWQKTPQVSSAAASPAAIQVGQGSTDRSN
jgi:hypothetical protein